MFAVNNASTTLHQKLYSPLMLNTEWSRTMRFLFVLFCTCFGSTMNGFFVASFFIERKLMKISNVFLGCAGLADLMITAGPIATSAIVLLSGQWDNLEVCRFVQFTTEFATYAYNLFFLLAAIENFYRVCRKTGEYKIFMFSIGRRSGVISIFVYILCLIFAAVGVSFDLDYDYCERQFYGNSLYRSITSTFFYIVPVYFTLIFLLCSLSGIRTRTQRRSRAYLRNYYSTVSNVTAYTLYVVAWMPYVIIVNGFPGASDGLYYNALWLGLLRSVFSGFTYGITSMYFRRTYIILFKYCCCKISLPGSVSNRRRRAFGPESSTGRHHIALTLRETRV